MIETVRIMSGARRAASASALDLELLLLLDKRFLLFGIREDRFDALHRLSRHLVHENGEAEEHLEQLEIAVTPLLSF